MLKSIVKICMCFALLQGPLFAQTQQNPADKIVADTPCTKECFEKFSTLRKKTVERFTVLDKRMQQYAAEAEKNNSIPQWQLKQLKLGTANAYQSLQMLEEIPQNDLDEKMCQSFIQMLESLTEMFDSFEEIYKAFDEVK